MNPKDRDRLLEILASRPLLRRKDLARRYGVDVLTIDRWHRKGALPPAIYLKAAHVPLWCATDLDRWEIHQVNLKGHRTAALADLPAHRTICPTCGSSMVGHN